MSYSNILKPTLITGQQYGTKVSVEIDHSDTTIDELFDAFQTICLGLGYHESAWKDWIIDRATEYNEDTDFKDGFKMPTDEEIEQAFLEHNMIEDGYDPNEFDDYGQKINKK